MNLLEAQWIPVRDACGTRRWIAPHQITEHIDACPIVAIDSARPDFNGAMVQFLIGLVQTAWVHAGREWDRDVLLFEPPSPADLQSLFAPFAHAFEFDGDGPRFMQDRTLGATDKPSQNDIAALLIDTPGEQSRERNTDHFIKRGRVDAVCLDCAAAALFTLMTNAPSGGAGHRTSLRGGGPLTTLVVYDPESADHPPHALWRDVACNVVEPSTLLQVCDGNKTALEYTFPWLVAQERLQPGEELQPLDAHPAQMFWAMPRRVRLDFATTANGTCSICERKSGSLITQYITKNYGFNYKGPWRHPLSPYYRNKPADPVLLPMHPQPGGLGYRYWLGWVLGVPKRVEPATVLSFYTSTGSTSTFRLWAFGYDMDNMKARCWYEATFPLFKFPPGHLTIAETLDEIISRMLDGAEAVAQYLRWAVRDAWFGDGEARGDLGFVDAAFWSNTEGAFFDVVRDVVTLIHADPDGAVEASADLKRRWLDQLCKAAITLFDQHAASGVVEACHPERLAQAWQSFNRQLKGDKLLMSVGLKAAEVKPARRRVS